MKRNSNYNYSTVCNNISQVLSRCNIYNNDQNLLFDAIDQFWESNDSTFAIEKASFVSSVQNSPDEGDCTILFVPNITEPDQSWSSSLHIINKTTVINDQFKMSSISFISMCSLNKTDSNVYQTFLNTFGSDS